MAHDTLATAPDAAPSLLLGGRDEMNIAEFPITLLSDRSPKGLTKIEHKDRIVDPKSGKEIIRKLTITAHEEYGLPTSIDDDIILALIQLTKKQNNFTRPQIFFTRRQLLEMLGWADKGRNYDRIEQSFERWTSIFLRYENAWWDHEGRQWTSGGFHIIDSFKCFDSRKGNDQGELFRSYVVWGSEFFKSCQAGYLKSLDYDLYIRLKFHPSKRMYRFLDKRFYHKPEWTFELRDFAIEHVGLSRTYSDAGKIKEKLQPGIEELEAIGFLEPLPRDERYQKQGRDWLIRLIRRQAQAVALPPEPVTEVFSLARELASRGVSASAASEIVRGHASELIKSKIEVFDWLAERKDRRIQKSPAGYLVASIRQDYAPPQGFETREVREQRARQAEEAHRQQEEARRRAAEERIRTEAEEAAAERYWNSLPPEEQDRIEAEALRAYPADDAIRKTPLWKGYRRTMRIQFLREIMRTGETP
ncbi:MAG: replication initiator protein A, partial [Isosphaeraceae bacterium]